ncbi:hypothetical protein ANCCEY_08514 [Ancylostoma ceylanicum]|uniref:Major facilitator superfamily (MFS) profile domain-containing protein n=1 Tax=Ancylostoma ceylanicum TaxID=53326 RepID=A0A0D6LQV4_9BILA|nr:hypothetical protein ANCCEY_08514 [Ancylostoma ceylanicum]
MESRLPQPVPPSQKPPKKLGIESKMLLTFLAWHEKTGQFIRSIVRVGGKQDAEMNHLTESLPAEAQCAPKMSDSASVANCEAWWELLHAASADLDYPTMLRKVRFRWICDKTAYLASLFSQIQFAGVLCGLAPTWQVLMAIRFFVGLSVGGTLVVVCTFVMEMLLPQQRMALRAFFNWGVARLLMTLLCMIFPEWRAASIACAITALPALIILIFVFPESPTWLHNKGRLEEMRAAERYIARFAGVEYKPVVHKKIEHNKTLCEMLHTGGLHRRLFVLWTMWFVASVCGYATDLNSNTISGDFFINQIIFSILIAVSKMLTYANVYWAPSLYLTVVILGIVNLIISYFFLVETKDVNLDSVTLEEAPTSDEALMLEDDSAKE